MAHLLITCFQFSTDSQFAIRVPGLLSRRVEFVRLQLCQIPTFLGGCISHIYSKIYYPTKDASMGKGMILETHWWVYSFFFFFLVFLGSTYILNAFFFSVPKIAKVYWLQTGWFQGMCSSHKWPAWKKKRRFFASYKR